MVDLQALSPSPRSRRVLTRALLLIACVSLVAGVAALRGSGTTAQSSQECRAYDEPPPGAPQRDGTGPGPSPEFGVWLVGVDGSGHERVPASLDRVWHRPSVAWSPDWSRLAYVNSVGDVVAVDPNGTGEATVVHDAPAPGQFVGDILGELHLSDLAWSPDGTRLAGVYRGADPGPDWFRDVSGVGVLDVDTSELHRLTSTRRNGSTGSPAWSPDSTRIVFSADSLPASSAHRLEIVDVDGSGHRVLVDNSDRGASRSRGGGVTPGAWSPDGELIMYGAGGGYHDTRIEVIHPDGTGRRPIIDDCSASDFAWSPDGTRIAFADSYGILVMDRDGTDMTRVPNSWHGYEPTWSPDATRVAFLRR